MSEAAEALAFVLCSGCGEPVPAAPVHCTLCGSHFHPACAPRIATDAAFDGLLRHLTSGLNASLLQRRRSGPQATILALVAVVSAIWGRPIKGLRFGSALPAGPDAERFAKEAARLDDSYDALATELALLHVREVA